MEEKATLYFRFGNYIYGVKIPKTICGLLEDFFTELIINHDVRVHYHGIGVEDHSEILDFWIEWYFYVCILCVDNDKSVVQKGAIEFRIIYIIRGWIYFYLERMNYYES